MQDKWNIIWNVNVIMKSNYFTILLPSLDIVFVIIAVINHMVSINSLTTWGQMIPAGGIDDFHVWRCHAESCHPESSGGLALLHLSQMSRRARFQTLHIAEQVQTTCKPQTCALGIPGCYHSRCICVGAPLSQGARTGSKVSWGSITGQLLLAQSWALLAGRLSQFNTVWSEPVEKLLLCALVFMVILSTSCNLMPSTIISRSH